jgi:hypothetical protein
VKVKAVHVDEVDRPASQRALDRAPARRMNARSHGRRDLPGRTRGGDQYSARAGARAGDHDRAMACADQGCIELAQDLLRAADGVPTDRGERKGNAQDGKAHGWFASAAARPPTDHATCTARPG